MRFGRKCKILPVSKRTAVARQLHICEASRNFHFSMKFLRFDLSEFFCDLFHNSHWNILKSSKQYFNQPSPQHQSIQMPSSAKRRLREEPHVHCSAPHQVFFLAPAAQLWMIPHCAVGSASYPRLCKNAGTQLPSETQQFYIKDLASSYICLSIRLTQCNSIK